MKYAATYMICTCMYATNEDKKLVTHVASIKAYNTCSYHLNFEPIIIVRKTEVQPHMVAMDLQIYQILWL